MAAGLQSSDARGRRRKIRRHLAQWGQNRDVPAGAAYGARHLQSMITYMRGGILIEGGAPAFSAVSRSAGEDIWERTGHHTFRIFFRAHSFDNLGRLVRITELESHPRLIEGDNSETPDVVEPYY